MPTLVAESDRCPPPPRSEKGGRAWAAGEFSVPRPCSGEWRRRAPRSRRFGPTASSLGCSRASQLARRATSECWPRLSSQRRAMSAPSRPAAPRRQSRRCISTSRSPARRRRPVCPLSAAPPLARLSAEPTCTRGSRRPRRAKAFAQGRVAPPGRQSARSCASAQTHAASSSPTAAERSQVLSWRVLPAQPPVVESERRHRRPRAALRMQALPRSPPALQRLQTAQLPS